jgi:hypothetical protein
MHKFLRPALAPLSSLLIFGLLSIGGAMADTPVVEHLLEVRIDPTAGELTATDRLTLPPGQAVYDLILHTGLSPQVTAGDASLVPLERQGHLELLRLRLPGDGGGTVTLAYGGPIRHALSEVSEGMGRERQTTPGTIEPDGVFLDGGSGWYPQLIGSLQRFELTATLPAGWVAISQGAGPGQDGDRAGLRVSTWSESQPQDDIYLIAAPFTGYRDPGAGVEAQVWLRRPDDQLAAAYLAATREYVDLYSRLIGPYPYAKFALVENFWETGYGMPSFTLLGPRVIRMPFIIRTSYPHEVLHNWWGNGVYVDYRTGNWSEGLTAYLADHLMKEQEGQGAAYRRDSLQAYADYVRTGQDLPLTAFKGRHGAASQAVGYGKSAMLFHGLRVRLGDHAFVRGLQRFYADNRFRAAGYDDLRQAFESASGRDLGAVFTAWTTRTGAPRLALSEVQAEPLETGFRITGLIRQTQSEAPYPLALPVVAHPVDGPPREVLVEVAGREGRFSIDLPSAPARLALDPAFDSFRALEPGESPVSLSGLFGAERGLILIPAAADRDLLTGYQDLANAWQRGHPGWEVALDSETGRLPQDRPVWILGWENRFLGAFADGAQGFQVDPAGHALSIGGDEIDPAAASLALTRERGGQPLGWVAADRAAALPGLARKLPHYGKYGYLVFAGAAPDNRLKGQWPPGDSPLVHWFIDTRPELEPSPRPSLDAVTRSSSGAGSRASVAQRL